MLIDGDEIVPPDSHTVYLVNLMYLVLNIINEVLFTCTCLKQISFSTGEAFGKPGSKVPCQNGGFTVSGLPDNIYLLKSPTLMV